MFARINTNFKYFFYLFFLVTNMIFRYLEKSLVKIGEVSKTLPEYVTKEGLKKYGFSDWEIEQVIKKGFYSDAIGQNRYCEIYPVPFLEEFDDDFQTSIPIFGHNDTLEIYWYVDYHTDIVKCPTEEKMCEELNALVKDKPKSIPIMRADD